MNLSEFFSEGYYKRYLWYLLAAFFGYLLLRGCLPSKEDLPQAVHNQIQERYRQCISPEETPIWPGEPRTPECGQVDVKVVGPGTVPAWEQSRGMEKVICFRVMIQNPYWTTAGPGVVRHEIKFKTRTASKVTVLENGAWKTFPDEDQQDRIRWEAYACPEAYEDKVE